MTGRRGTHGAHREGCAPHGVPADSATKHAWTPGHYAFGLLWQSGR